MCGGELPPKATVYCSAKCRRKNDNDRMYAKRKEELNRRRSVIHRHKKMCGCVDCGYNENAWALQYDHRGDKKFEIGSSLYGRNWDSIKAEIRKCDVRCANCHLIKTYSERSL